MSETHDDFGPEGAELIVQSSVVDDQSFSSDGSEDGGLLLPLAPVTSEYTLDVDAPQMSTSTPSNTAAENASSGTNPGNNTSAMNTSSDNVSNDNTQAENTSFNNNPASNTPNDVPGDNPLAGLDPDMGSTAGADTGETAADLAENEEEEMNESEAEEVEAAKENPFPLVPLDPYNSDDYKEFVPRHFHWASILTPSGIHLPSFRGKKWEGIALKFTIFGGRIDKHLQLMAIIESADLPEPVRVGYMEIRECDLAEAVTMRLSKENGDDKSGNDTLTLGISYNNISVSGVDNVDPEWTEEIKAVFSYLASLRNPVGTQQMTLVLKVVAAPKALPDNEAFQDRLATLDRFRQPFIAYLTKALNPNTIWGQMRNRHEIIRAQRLNNGPGSLIPIPAINHFKTVEEGVIKLTYGRHINHMVETKMFEDLRTAKHEVCFYELSKDLIAAALTWGSELAEAIDLPIDERTIFSLTWTVDGLEKECKYQGQSIHILEPFNLPGNVKLLITSGSASFFIDNGISSHISTGKARKFMCNVSVDVSDKLAKYDVDGVNKLLDHENERWFPAFLNHCASSTEPKDPTGQEVTGFSKEELDEQMEATLALEPNLDQYQIDAVKGIREVRNNFHAIHGPPGTGKTLVTGLITNYLVASEMAVLVVAPSHSATNRSFRQIKDYQKSERSVQKRPLRLFRHIHEKHQIEEYGQGEGDDNDDLSPANLEDAESLGHHLMAEMAALRAFKLAPRKRQFTLPQESLSATIIEDALHDDTKRCLGQYFCPRSEMQVHGRGNSKVYINPKPVVNFWLEMRAFLKRIEAGEKVYAFSPEDKSHFRKCFIELQRQTITGQRILITTDGNAQKIPGEFGKGSSGIVVIFDEAAYTTEARVWAVILRLALTESIKAVVLVGDHEQLHPLVLGNEYNEFGKQLEFSLLQRLLTYGFPSHMLRTQHRMHTAIAEFPMLYTYKGLVTNGGGVKRPLDPKLKAFLKETTGEVLDPRLRVTLWDMQDGEVLTEDLSQSRYNLKNVQFVVAFCLKVLEKCGVEVLQKFVILTPYGAQKRRIMSALTAAANEMRIDWTVFPLVKSIDSFQGEDSKYVLVDLVLTGFDKLKFMSDARRMNVTCTRGQDYVGFVGQSSMSLSQQYTTNWKQTKTGRTGITVINPKPYLIAMMEFLVAKRYAVLVWAGPDVSADGKTVARVEHFHLTKPAGYNPGSFSSSAFGEIDKEFSSTAWGAMAAAASIPWTDPKPVVNPATTTTELQPEIEGKPAAEEIAKEEEPADIATSAEMPLAEGEEPVETERSAEEATEEEEPVEQFDAEEIWNADNTPYDKW